MRIVLTGGGTGGHVVPNLAVIEELKKIGGCELLYIGSRGGPEKELIEAAGVPFRAISCGKLRRYFSLRNFFDMVKVPIGVFQANKILKQFKPDVIFAKGGFVSVPVVFAARKYGIRVVLHESDVIPGLANKICAKYAGTICISFEASREYFSKYANRVILTGNPIREWIRTGDRSRGFDFTGLVAGKPVLLVMGGSQGAMQINNLLKEALTNLLDRFQVLHICGQGNIENMMERKGYVQYEYIDKELADVYAITDVIVSRGGANSLSEIAFLQKKAVIIPLGSHASRGDQVANAFEFSKNFGFRVLKGKIDKKRFLKTIDKVSAGISPTNQLQSGTGKIVDLILKK